MSRGSVFAAIAVVLCSGTSELRAQDLRQRGATLEVTGSASNENVTLTGGAAGDVFVTGGGGQQLGSFSGINRIEINLRGGDDVLTLTNLALNGGVINASLGLGADTAYVTGNIDASLILDGDAGEDYLDLSGAAIFRNVEIYGGLRDDVIDLTGAYIEGDLLVDGQAGADDVYYSSLFVVGRTRIDVGGAADFATGSGAFFTGDVELVGGLGADYIYNSGNVYNSNLTVSLGGGRDEYYELNSFVNGNYHVDGGAGRTTFDDSGTVVLGSRTTRRL